MLVNAGLLGFVIEELKKYLQTMDYEHDYQEPVKDSKDKVANNLNDDDVNDKTLMKEKTGLFKRRKSSSKEDGLSVVIERDDMFVGFSETVDSDSSDSQNEEESRKNQIKSLKRSLSRSPIGFNKVGCPANVN